MKPTWWWCLEHKKVEEGFGCGSSNRVGPYDNQRDAATAMDRIKTREAEQEARDEREKKK